MITFDNASLLSYAHTPKFLGELSFAYAVEKNLKIKGTLADFTNTSGVSGVFSGLYDLRNLSNAVDDVVINGVSLGSGYIKNISVEKGNWVRSAPYTAEIIVFGSGDLYNMTGRYFTGVSGALTAGNYLPYARNISESFQISIDSASKYSYEHSFGFSFEGVMPYDSVDAAKSLASGIIGKELPMALFPSGFSLSGKKYYEEAYDAINNKFSFVERMSKNASGDYADIDYAYKLQRNEMGICQIAESAKILGLQDSRFDGAKTKLNAIKIGAYNRCGPIYSGYNAAGILGPTPVSQGYNTNSFEGTIDLESVFSDDPFIAATYSWEQSVGVTISENEILTTVSLTVEGDGKPNSAQKIANAIYGYNEKVGGMYVAAYSAYSAVDFSNRICPLTLSSIHQKNDKRSCSRYDGKIGASMSYTDRNVIAAPAGTVETVTTTTTKSPTDIWTDYHINNKIIRQQHSQQSMSEVITEINRKYGSDVPYDTLASFPDDMRKSTVEGEIITAESISINPPNRSAQYSVTIVK